MFNETPRPTIDNDLPTLRGARRYRLSVACVVLLALGLQGFAAPAAAEVVNRIVLRVNEEILTLYEYEQRKANEISIVLSDQRLDSTRRQERLEQVGKMVLQNSFSELLLLSFANQQGIRITDAEVEEAVRGLLERQGIESDEQLQEALSQSGMTFDQVRQNTKRELLWQQVVGREVQPKVAISEEELRAYYRTHKDDFREPEQRWVKEVIVLESSGLDDSELQRIAQEIRDQLAAGGDLQAVIEPYREKEITTGVVDHEWLREDELEATLSGPAWALVPGETSPPVLARGGYHILMLTGLREAKLKPLDEVENLIRQREYGKRFNRELRTFLADLEAKSFIQEDLPEEAVGYRSLTADFQTEDEIELFRAPVIEPSLNEDGGEGAEEPSDGR